MKKIRPASNLETNNTVFNLITANLSANKRILDIGAGRGYMIQRLAEHLLNKGLFPEEILTACDLYPQYFEPDIIKCGKAEIYDQLQYGDNLFDIVYAIEVLEHLRNPYDFIDEAYRILRPDGMFIMTIPNILNIKSRIEFFLNGFYTLFGPLSFNTDDAGRLSGHIMPLHYYYIEYGMRRSGFKEIQFHVDRIKKSSSFIYFLLFPLYKMATRFVIKRTFRKEAYLYQVNSEQINMMNSYAVLCSRSCILSGIKNHR